MSHIALDVGFLPLLDAAPLVIAREIGFAAEEGLDLRLHREPSWAVLRDRLALENHQAAQMLAPMPIALSAGLGGLQVEIDVLSVLSVNGNLIGARPDLVAGMGKEGQDFGEAAAVGRALLAAAGPGLRIGVPFPVSMHAELLHYWLRGLAPGAPAEFEIRTVPPPRMAAAIAKGEIDAFSVGEPWGSVAVEAGAAELILPGAAIWKFAPEKLLAVRRQWADANPDVATALLRSVWRAGRWLAAKQNVTTATEILSRPGNLDTAAEILERPMRRRMVINARGDERNVPAAIEFFDGAATFPWRSQALWIAESLARRAGGDAALLREVARRCFRPDLYRAALGPIGADLPGASEKLEGALPHRTEVASTLGKLLLGPDSFFDGRSFEP